MKTIIVLPTYNESENIQNIIKALQKEFEKIQQELDFQMNILVVDDYSPDGTAQKVKEMQSEFSNVYLIQNNNRGLGNAYIKGFKHAINELNADVLMEMDSDFSHDPKDIIRFLKEIKNGYDFVIGSRYVENGSIPDDWGWFRKANSYWGNVFARHVAGVGVVHDCTSGFRAINASLIKKIDLDNLNANGYYFQLKLLFVAVKKDAKVKEIPIQFVDREHGKSKLGLKDITEFIINSIKIRLTKV